MPGPPALVPMDATYHLSMLVPHAEASLSLTLDASGLSYMIDENWGVKGVKLIPLKDADVPAPDDEAIATAFAAAIDATSTKQPEAFNLLVAGLDRTVNWMSDHVTPAGPAAADVTAAIDALAGDDHHMQEREAAETTLFDFGPVIEAALRDARLKTRGEQKYRVERTLGRINAIQVEDDAIRRVLLATRVLEVIDTPNAKELRARLIHAN